MLPPTEDDEDPPGAFPKLPPPLNGFHQVADDPDPDGPASSSSDESEINSPSNVIRHPRDDDDDPEPVA